MQVYCSPVKRVFELFKTNTMKKLFSLTLFLLMSAIVLGQVTHPQQLIRIGSSAELSRQLNLDPDKAYGFLAIDIQHWFPSLVKEKKISERFGKNAYRTKTVKVIDEAALVAALVASLKSQAIELTDLKKKLVLLESKM